MGILVQLPKIPSILSESIVASEVQHGRGPMWKGPVQVMPGGAKADLIVKWKSKEFRVEVKGTGRQGFQNLVAKDVAADVLVWVDFGNFFEDEFDSPVVAYWVSKPSSIFPDSMKISLQNFRKRCGTALRARNIRISSSSQRQRQFEEKA